MLSRPIPKLAPNLQIRSYLTTDWSEVCRVHDAARLQELAAGAVDLRAFRPMAEAAEGDEFFASVTLVACNGETIAGFVSWNQDYITWLYIDPPCQRQGIGRQLLTAAVQNIGPGAWTSMLGGNEPALALYRSVGMEVVWTRSSECDGYPCQGMRLALPTSRMRDPEAKR